MTDTKLIVVVGATGAQGGSVANTFLSDPSWTVRAITRSSSSAKAQSLREKGAEVFEANLNNVASIERAFEGAHVVYGVTDFWTLYADPSIRATVRPGQTVLQLVHDLELQQGKNIFDAASKTPTLERLIYSSLPNVTKLSAGKYTNAYHFDSKAAATEYGEKHHPDVWSKTSIIQLGFYLSNMLHNPWTAPKKNVETGTYDFTTHFPDSVMPFVATEDDTGVYVKALIAASPGVNLTAYRKRMSVVEYAELWSEILGVKARVLKGTMDQAPPELKKELDDTFAWGNEFGLFGEKVDTSLTSPQDLDPSLELTEVEGWIRAQDWSPILQA